MWTWLRGGKKAQHREGGGKGVPAGRPPGGAAGGGGSPSISDWGEGAHGWAAVVRHGVGGPHRPRQASSRGLPCPLPAPSVLHRSRRSLRAPSSSSNSLKQLRTPLTIRRNHAAKNLPITPVAWGFAKIGLQFSPFPNCHEQRAGPQMVLAPMSAASPPGLQEGRMAQAPPACARLCLTRGRNRRGASTGRWPQRACRPQQQPSPPCTTRHDGLRGSIARGNKLGRPPPPPAGGHRHPARAQGQSSVKNRPGPRCCAEINGTTGDCSSTVCRLASIRRAWKKFSLSHLMLVKALQSRCDACR